MPWEVIMLIDGQNLHVDKEFENEIVAKEFADDLVKKYAEDGEKIFYHTKEINL